MNEYEKTAAAEIIRQLKQQGGQITIDVNDGTADVVKLLDNMANAGGVVLIGRFMRGGCHNVTYRPT